MKILFLSLIDFDSLESRGIYTDLLREFVTNKHEVYIVSPCERRKRERTHIIDKNEYKILKLQIGNIQKVNFIEKGISTILIENIFINGVKKNFHREKFDLVLYATPPVTLQKVVEFIKRRDNAKAYLLLKDIWPQGIVDMQALSKTGWKSLIYKYFRKKEKRLYQTSDYIGCMSKANVDYILKHNTEIQPDIVEICPNSIEPIVIEKDEEIIRSIRIKYSIPQDKVIFVYGGNLGIPQGIDFLIECLEVARNNDQIYFVIVGSGTQFSKLNNHIRSSNLQNVRLFGQLPKNDYDVLVNSCDVGLIFLDHRFTIPNYPSRLLSYMQASMPVLAATDVHTDIRQTIEEGKFGLWCESNDVTEFYVKLLCLCNQELRREFGYNARNYLEQNYTSTHTYNIIVKHFCEL